MMQQFFGRPFWFFLALSAAMYADAILSYTYQLGAWTLGVYAIGVFLVTYKKLEWGLMFVFLELFINPHGKLIFALVGDVPIALRMVIFLAFMCAWLLLIAQKRVPFVWQRAMPFLVLFVGVLLGSLGLLVHAPMDAFQDGNAYLYLLYVFPLFSIEWNQGQKRLLLQCLAAGATWVALLSFFGLYLYSHFSEQQLEFVYLFLRDTRIAEITPVSGALYRVFIQSQFFVIVFGFLILGLLFESAASISRRWFVLLLTPVCAISLLSLSRSFWVGLLGAVVVALSCWMIVYKPTKRQIFDCFCTISASALTSIVLLMMIVYVPLPSARSRADFSDAFKERTGSDVAVSSRWKLLDPMMQQIMQAPILGNGFGTMITFTTDDPRIRSIHPDGIWSTYSLEWGWLELWLKMGIFGPLGFLLLGWTLARSWILQFKGEQRWLAVGLLASLTFLYGTHIFSPYLNHPIGLGFLLFASVFAQDPRLSFTYAFEQIRSIFGQKKSTVPALTLHEE